MDEIIKMKKNEKIFGFGLKLFLFMYECRHFTQIGSFVWPPFNLKKKVDKTIVLIKNMEEPKVHEKDGTIEDVKIKGDTEEDNILTQINMPGVCLINSKSQGGKSHAGHCIFYANRKKFSWGIGFGNTIFNQNNMSFVPRRFKHMRYNPNVLREVLLQQIAAPEERRPLVFIYFDDCISDFQQEDKVLMEAVTQTFHYNIFIMVTTQSINKLPNYVRENSFQVILFKLFTKGQIQAAYESYGQDFDTIKDFKNSVNNKLGDPKDHIFAYINKHKGGKWRFCKCPPPPLPSFKFKYGPDDDDDDGSTETGKRDSRKKRKRRRRNVDEQESQSD